MAKSLHALGLSLRAIAERLEAAGHMNSNGRQFAAVFGAEHAGVTTSRTYNLSNPVLGGDWVARRQDRCVTSLSKRFARLRTCRGVIGMKSFDTRDTFATLDTCCGLDTVGCVLKKKEMELLVGN